MLKYILSIIICCITTISALSQSVAKKHLLINPSLPFKYSLKSSYPDSANINIELAKINKTLSSKGYLNSKITNISEAKDTFFVSYDFGQSFEWKELKYDTSLLEVISQIDIKKNATKRGVVNETEIINDLEQILKYCEDHGYPFAELKFENIIIVDNKISANVHLDLNESILIDTIRISEPHPVHKSFLKSYLRIKEGDYYSETKLRQINNKLIDLPFIQVKEPVVVYFINNSADVQLSLQRKNANRFDGLLGILPSSVPGQKTQVVGQLELNLLNSFKRGERFDFEFKAQPNSTRDLKTYFSFPYLFSLPFGVDFAVLFRRQDTTFSTFSRSVGLSYLSTSTNFIRFNYVIDESNLLSTKQYENSTALPTIQDVRRNSYAITWNIENIDYRVNPTKGYLIQLNASFGIRNIKKNSVFADSLYNGIDLNSNQYQLGLLYKQYLRIFKNQVVYIGFNGKKLIADPVFFNEQYRIGGINNLRGFDEESIFCSTFAITTLEYRFLLEKNSFIRAFYDQAYYENSILNIEDYPFGLGVGAQIQSAAGILQINYALGKQRGNPLDLRNGKVHFGIINYF